MPDTVHVQLLHAHSYLTQLIEQFAKIGEQIEQGRTVNVVYLAVRAFGQSSWQEH